MKNVQSNEKVSTRGGLREGSGRKKACLMEQNQLLLSLPKMSGLL